MPDTGDPVCPLRGRTLPTDGTPLAPSPALAQWRDEAAMTSLHFPDGHEGLIVTRHAPARAVLSDPRFSVATHRFPMPADAGEDPVDADAAAAIGVANLLQLDGDQHLRMRKAVVPHFSLKAVRARAEVVATIVATQLSRFLELPQPADLFACYATPLSARVHRLVLGVPDEMADEFDELFIEGAGTQARFDFIRRLIERRRDDPADDVITRLIEGDYTRHEVEGLLLVLMTSGRDSVAYLITTAVIALLTHPVQLALLREDPTLIATAIEEFMRVGAMFVTLFPRTAREDLQIEGESVRRGQTVAVSAVAANRDPRQFDDPEEFRIERDAFGHLGFGHGPHGCVGQQLARLEIQEAVMRLIEAAPELRLVAAEQLTPMPFAHPVATYEAGRTLVAW